MWSRVNKALLPMKGHYFLFNAGTAPVQPFLPVYARQLGFSSVVVGTIYLILPLAGMIAKPLFGAVADRFRMHKLLFLIFQVITIVAFFSIQFVPEAPMTEDATVTLACGSVVEFKTCKANKECAVDSVMAESDSNKTVSCFFNCQMTPDLQEELCASWKVLQLCGSRTNSVDAVHPISKMAQVSGGKTAHDDESPLDIGDHKFGFTATVPLQHTIYNEVQNCTYFRVQKAKFADRTEHVPYCRMEQHVQCDVTCDDAAMNRFLITRDVDESASVVDLYQYWLLLSLLIISWVGMAVVVSVADAICVELLGDRFSEYGNQRLWGSVGWGILAIIAGVVVDEVSRGQLKKNYTPAFYMMLVFLVMDFACSFTLKYEQRKISSNILSDLLVLLGNIRVIFFMLCCIIVGMCIGIQWNFLFWYLEDLAAAQGCDTVSWIKTIQGLVSGVQCFLGELPSFFISGWVLNKFGHVHSMTLVLIMLGIRFFLYSVLQNPWWCLPIELLQATFGLFYPTMATYASIVAPPGTEATVQGIVGAVFEGVGVSLGSWLGGQLFNSMGGAACFRIFGGIALGAGLIHAAVQYLLQRFDNGGGMQGKDFNGVARYASPNDAVSMLADT